MLFRSTIINTTLETILNVVEFGMNVQEAVDAPRFHHQWFPDRIAIEHGGFSPDTLAILKGRGHTLFELPYQGSAQAIRVDQSTALLEGGSDRRDADSEARGY